MALYGADKHSELLEFCVARLGAQPEQSDVIHDVLAQLAERMIALHKARQAALEELLLDLEGLLGPTQLEQIGPLYTPPRPPKPDDKPTRRSMRPTQPRWRRRGPSWAPWRRAASSCATRSGRSPSRSGSGC